MATLTNVSVGAQNSTAALLITRHHMDNWTVISSDHNHSINYEENDFLASSLEAKIFQVCWLVPSLVLILGLNVIFIITVLRSPSLWKPRFLLPVNLAILDILLSLAFIPSSVHNIVSESAIDSVFFCLTQCSVFFGIAICTASTLLVMAWDRHRAVCDPFHYQEEDGIRWTGVRVVASWVWSISLSAMSAIFTPTDGIDTAHIQRSNLFCTFVDTGVIWLSLIVEIFQAIGVAFIVLTALLIPLSYFKVYREILRQNTGEYGLPVGGAGGNPQGDRPRRTISIHLAIFIIFLTTVFTNAIMAIFGQETAAARVLKRAAQLVYLTVPCFTNPTVSAAKNSGWPRGDSSGDESRPTA
ncbi:olfactory receptor 10A4-like [Branchiostoma floridae x Branchiostoma japonicum]